MTAFDDPWEWFDPEIGRQNVHMPYKPDAKAFETYRRRAAVAAAARGWSPLREDTAAVLLQVAHQSSKDVCWQAMRDIAGVERLSTVPEALLPALRLKLTELRK